MLPDIMETANSTSKTNKQSRPSIHKKWRDDSAIKEDGEDDSVLGSDNEQVATKHGRRFSL
jgi:hypothetical protein